MTSTAGPVTGGVDTHGRTHHAAVLDALGRQLGDRQFPATSVGYRQLLAWLREQGEIVAVGVEGTGSYGAGLTRLLRQADVPVVEVDRPDRRARRATGKSDPLDAYAAARAVQAGTATGTPKQRDGAVEAIRALRIARSSAVKARTQATNQLRALLVTAPARLREQLQHLPTGTLIDTCSRLRTSTTRTPNGQPAPLSAEHAVKTALRRLARRCLTLSEEIADADRDLHTLVANRAPQLLALPGVGVEVAGQLLTSAGDNPDRLRHEAAFAHLCGTAPLPASSGRIQRHRLSRSGDRHANSALHIIALSRLRHDPRTRAYAQRRTAQGKTKREIIRCLKRYIAREIYNHLTPPTTLDTP